MEKQTEKLMTFDMNGLRSSLPHKRGLSRFYSGKSRSFTCIADVHCLEDLKKPERHDVKKRKKSSDKKNLHIPPYPMYSVSGATRCARPCAGA